MYVCTCVCMYVWMYVCWGEGMISIICSKWEFRNYWKRAGEMAQTSIAAFLAQVPATTWQLLTVMSHLGEAKASRWLSWRWPTVSLHGLKMGEPWEAKSRETSSQDCFLELTLLFLSLLHSLMILGHQPTLLGRFPEDQHKDHLPWIKVVIEILVWFK